jgi:hypothetical protein
MTRIIRLLLVTLTILNLAFLPAAHGQFQDDHGAPQFAAQHFAGILNDYTPSTVKGGPWEVRGKWTLNINNFAHTADFTAALTMETSDYGVTTGVVDPTNTATRAAHTHHIVLAHASLSTDTSHCSGYSPATTGPVIVVTGEAQIITGNGGPAPFQSMGDSTLWVCLAGGTQVPYSNLSLQFVGPATGHFGTQFFHGVVVPEQH